MIACPGFSPRVRLGGRPVPVYLAITTSFRAVRVFLRVFCISRRFLCAFGKERGQLMGLSYFFSLTVCEVADLSRRAHPQPFGDPFSSCRCLHPQPRGAASQVFFRVVGKEARGLGRGARGSEI